LLYTLSLIGLEAAYSEVRLWNRSCKPSFGGS